MALLTQKLEEQSQQIKFLKQSTQLEDMKRRQYQMEKNVHALMERQKTTQQEMQLPPKQDLETDTSSQIHPGGYPGPAAAAIQKPAPFDGSIPWDTYQLQFEAVAKMNHWGEQDKAAHLTMSLRGLLQEC